MSATVRQDLRHALRMLRRTPGFTLAVLATLALAIGANTAIFSVAHGVLMRPLPYPDADRLTMVWMDNSRIALREDWHSYPGYTDYRTGNTTVAHTLDPWRWPSSSWSTSVWVLPRPLQLEGAERLRVRYSRRLHGALDGLTCEVVEDSVNEHERRQPWEW